MTPIVGSHLYDLHRKSLDRRLRLARQRFWIAFTATAVLTIASFCGIAAAKADDLNFNYGVQGYSITGPHGSTIVAPLGSSAPRIIQVPEGKIQWSVAKRARWYLRCRPRIRYDGLGVQHFVYAKAGCDVGLDRDPDYEMDELDGRD